MTRETPAILIVDSNPGFATMLKESLEEEEGYTATIALSAAEALEQISSHPFDLAIVDLGIEASGDLDGQTLARRLRDEQSDMRLILIPLAGGALPEKLSDLAVQGTLSKPFFLPDLADVVGTALTQPVQAFDLGSTVQQSAGETPETSEAAEQQPLAEEVAMQPRSTMPDAAAVLQEPPTSEVAHTPAEQRAPEKHEVPEEPRVVDEAEAVEETGVFKAEKARAATGTMGGEGARGVEPSSIIDDWPPAATRELERLAQELNAEAALVTQRGAIVSAVGRVPRERQEALAEAIWESCYLSERAARVLGAEPSDFDQSTEGSGYLLYTLSIVPDVLLSVAVSSGTALGYVRHVVKGTAKSLRRLLSAF